jgi:hypothetical protein
VQAAGRRAVSLDGELVLECADGDGIHAQPLCHTAFRRGVPRVHLLQPGLPSRRVPDIGTFAGIWALYPIGVGLRGFRGSRICLHAITATELDVHEKLQVRVFFGESREVSISIAIGYRSETPRHWHPQGRALTLVFVSTYVGTT